MTQQELTPSKIIEDLDNLPVMTGLTGAIRNIVVLENRVETMLRPIVERRGNQHADFIERVFEVLQPVYDAKAELGSDLTIVALRVYTDALTAAIVQLSGDGIKVELNSNGKIKSPATLGQYDTNVRRVLEFDFNGEFLDTLPDGTYKYQSKPSIEKLGKDLAKAKAKADEDAAMERLKSSGKLSVLGQKEDEKQKQQQEPKGEQPKAAEEPAAPAAEPTVIDLAVSDLMDTIKVAREFASAEVSTGGTVEDWLVAKVAEFSKRVSNLLAHNLRAKAGEALDKAASKVA